MRITIANHIDPVTHPGAVLVLYGTEHRWQPGEFWYGDFSREHPVRNTGPVRRVHAVIDALSPASSPSSSPPRDRTSSPPPTCCSTASLSLKWGQQHRHSQLCDFWHRVTPAAEWTWRPQSGQLHVSAVNRPKNGKVAIAVAEHPHATLVRKGYDAFSRGDMDALRELMSGDATHHVPGTHLLSGDFKGQDAVLDMYRQLFEETNETLRIELRQVLVDGRGHAVSVHHFTAERQGKQIDENGSIIFRIVGDKITDLDECVEDIDRSNDFWS